MENLEKEYQELSERYELITTILNAKPVENDSTKYLEKFKSLMENDFKNFTRTESTMTEDAIAISKLYEVLDELTDSVRFPMISTKIIVAVAGGFSSGKSKFLNTIIHNENVKLSTGIEPVTAIPTFIQQNKTSSITSFSPDGRQGEIPVNLFNKIDHNFLEKLNINLKNIMPYVTVNTSFIEKCSELKNICFIDTPGYDAGKTAETEEDKNVAFDTLQKASSVLWFIDIESGTLRKNDVLFLSKLNEINIKKIFVVISRVDRKKSQIQSVINQIKEDLDDNDIIVDGISAYSSNEKKEYLDEENGKSIFDWLNEQDKNIVNTAENVQLLIKKIEEVFDMYQKSIEHDDDKYKKYKDNVNRIRLQIEEKFDKIERLKESLKKGYDDFDRFTNRSKYLPADSDGETMGTQAATALSTLVNRYFYDEDVYDNRYDIPGQWNNISGYANWLYEYIPETRGILDRIEYIDTKDMYINLLYDLCELVDPMIPELDKSPKQGYADYGHGPFEYDYSRSSDYFYYETYYDSCDCDSNQSFDSDVLLELVEDRSKTNRTNLRESKRICSEMITCIKNLFKTLNPNLLDMDIKLDENKMNLPQQNKKKTSRRRKIFYTVEKAVKKIKKITDRNTPLYNIIKNRKKSLDRLTKDGLTPLMVACSDGHSEAVDILIKTGVKLDTGSKTALMLAVLGGHAKIVQMLIDAGADFNKGYYVSECDNEFGTPEQIANLHNYGDVKYNSSCYSSYRTPIQIAYIKGYHDIVEILEQAGAQL